MIRAPDSTGLGERTVVLHRVGRDGGAPVDTTRTGGDGSFAFRLPAADSGAVFLATTRYDGVLYFGPAAHFGDAPDSYRITVYRARAVSDGDSLVLRARTVVLTREGDGLRVMDLVDVQGLAGRTLVGAGRPDTAGAARSAGDVPAGADGGVRSRGGGGPWWSVTLPAGAVDPEVLPGGVDPEAVEFGAGRVRVGAVVPPPGRRVALGYRLPGDVPVEYHPRRPVRRFELLVRNPEGAELEVSGLRSVGTVESPQGPVQRYRGTGIGAGDTIRIRLAGGEGPGAGAWAALGAGVLLLAAAGWSWRRRSASRDAGADRA